MKQKISLTINGKPYTDEVEPRLLLIHYLREVVGLTGPHIGCETSTCGACTVAARRQGDEILHHVRRPGGWPRCADHRGACRQRQARSSPGGLLERARPAMRILHARHDPDCQATAGRQPQSHRARDPPGPGRQCLPMHRLSTHCQRRESGRGERRGHNHGHHHHQTRNPGRQAHPPPRRPAPHHRHGHLPG